MALWVTIDYRSRSAIVRSVSSMLDLAAERNLHIFCASLNATKNNTLSPPAPCLAQAQRRSVISAGRVGDFEFSRYQSKLDETESGNR